MYDLSKAKINRDVMRRLVADLYREPSGFPAFNMEYNYILTEDGPEGDVAAFIAARYLHTSKALRDYARDNDVVTLAMKVSGLSPQHMMLLVYPEPLLANGYPLHTITARDAAQLVESFIESDYTTPDYSSFLGEYETVSDRENVSLSIDRFLARYGQRT